MIRKNISLKEKEEKKRNEFINRSMTSTAVKCVSFLLNEKIYYRKLRRSDDTQANETSGHR